MTIYTIHEPPLRTGETSPDPERFVFVRDGFYFWAFLFGPLWIVRRGLWIVLILYAVVFGVLGNLMWIFRAGSFAMAIVSFLIAILLGMEAATLRRWTLTRGGWKNLGVVVGDDLESAEGRFFGAWADPAAAPPPSRPPPPQSLAATLAMGPRPPSGIIGSFPEPGAPR